MIKLYYKTTGEEPDVNCIEPCKYDCIPSEGTMIGSCSCKECSYCYGWDMEECWVKCLKHAMENGKNRKTLKSKYPSYCCQDCGECIGWLGRFVEWIYCGLVKHKCKSK